MIGASATPRLVASAARPSSALFFISPARRAAIVPAGTFLVGILNRIARGWERGLPHPDPLEVVTQFNRAWEAGDIEAALTYVADDAVYELHVSDEVLPFGGTTAGRAAIEAMLRRIRADWEYILYRPLATDASRQHRAFPGGVHVPSPGERRGLERTLPLGDAHRGRPHQAGGRISRSRQGRGLHASCGQIGTAVSARCRHSLGEHPNCALKRRVKCDMSEKPSE